ncbi:hypothetical protein CMI37_15020 [Candidatus Pacearchaeota archaeon]|nr:hypothetical protein [Candidatus Pacearchaeota archaeon]|tara:strand:- start:2553 stop:3221 length:669 start_codon:yes stop_codon:yes gene_type:complete
MTKLQKAKLEIGGLSRTSKMPCFSWGIPTDYCRRGKELHLKDKKSICGSCYAMKGAYLWKPTEVAYERRYQAWKNLPRQKWVDYMVTIFNSKAIRNRGHFRWFDSGDLQSISMLEDIILIAMKTPYIKHWLATREYDIVYKVQKDGAWIPDNLVIRLSHDHVDELDKLNISADNHQSVSISDRSIKLDKKQFTCPSLLQDNSCGDCRACWNSRVKQVAYIKH